MRHLLILAIFAVIAYASPLRIYQRSLAKHERIASAAEPLPFNQRLDHFNPNDNPTFIQYYYVNDSRIDGQGPVFIIISGESAASPNYMAIGEVAELAAANHALLLMLEHRFYGNSVPYYWDLTTENLGYLTSQQALADIAEFRSWIYSTYNLSSDTPTVVFGCSYSGALSSWFKAKYPHLANISLAGSAPVWATENFYQYDEVVRQAVGPACAEAIMAATAAVEAEITAGRFTEIRSLFGCTEAVNDTTAFMYILADNVAYAVQYNSKYPGLNATAAQMCSYFLANTSDPIGSYVNFMNYIYNQSDSTCDDSNMLANTDVAWNATGGGRQWLWQSCNEFGWFQTAPTNGPSLRSRWIDLQWHLNVLCPTLFGPGVLPNTAATNAAYGGQTPVTSYTIFSNGDADPWHPLSILSDMEHEVEAYIMAGAAHCANWYPVTPETSEAVVEVREKIAEKISDWLKGEGRDEDDDDFSLDQFVGAVVGVGVGTLIIGFVVGYFVTRARKPGYDVVH